MTENICCFLGHRTILMSDEIYEKTYNHIKYLIVSEKVDTFLFGSKSQFNDLCYQIVSTLTTDYPYIKRVYVRAQFPYISPEYKEYLLQNYEETYYPIKLLNAGKASYVERNVEMIDKSKFCVFYFDSRYIPPSEKKSGTKIAYEYALKKQKAIINIFDM